MITKKSCEETILLLKSVSFSLGPLLTFSQKSTKRALRQRSQKKTEVADQNWVVGFQIISQRHNCLIGSKAYLIGFSNIWLFSVIFDSLKSYLAVFSHILSIFGWFGQILALLKTILFIKNVSLPQASRCRCAARCEKFTLF